MSPDTSLAEEYCHNITRWAAAMAAGDIDRLADALDPGFDLDHVAWFVDGNTEKRIGVLLNFLEFVAPAFEDTPSKFEELVADYAESHPFAAMGTPTHDADACLAWIEQTQRLTPEQGDYLACQRARHAVEAAAAANRLAHVRFQELVSLAPRLVEELETNGDLTIHANPMHVYRQFHTRVLLGENDALPADVVFFAAGGNVSTAVLSGDAHALFVELAERGPWTLSAWTCLTNHADRDGLIRLCRDLATMGLVAFG